MTLACRGYGLSVLGKVFMCVSPALVYFTELCRGRFKGGKQCLRDFCGTPNTQGRGVDD